MKFHLQSIPLVSVNDDKVLLAQWLRKSGEYVEAHTVICEMETSKAVIDVEAEVSGYLFHLAEQSSMVPVGTPFAVLTPENDPGIVEQVLKAPKSDAAPAAAGKSYTKKAEILAKKHGIDIQDIPVTDGTVRESDVLGFLAARSAPKTPEGAAAVPAGRFFRERILVIGAGFGAAHIIDAAERSERQQAVGILDDSRQLHGTSVSGRTVLGPVSMLQELRQQDFFDTLILSFGDIKRRKELFEELSGQGFRFANVIDKTALIHAEVRIGSGNVLLANSRLGACSVLGDNNFLSAYVNLDHHNRMGSNCTFGPGVMSSGRVTIGDNIRFGTGIFIEPGFSIGSNSVIASGIVITSDIPEYATVKKQQDYRIKVRRPE